MGKKSGQVNQTVKVGATLQFQAVSRLSSVCNKNLLPRIEMSQRGDPPVAPSASQESNG
jgi:hypothetical protein